MGEIQIIVPERAKNIDPLGSGLIVLTEALSRHVEVTRGFLGGEFGYGAKYENDVFSMCPDYQDAECDCGFNQQADAWHEANTHEASCYQVILRGREAKWDEESGYAAVENESACDVFILDGERFHGTSEEAWQKHFREGGTFESRRSEKAESAFQVWKRLHDMREKAREAAARQLHKEMDLDWGTGFGWGCRCTCGVDERAKKYFEEHDHSATCALAIPNFRHKATGFEVRWYKWIGRDMETNGVAVDLSKIFNDCLASLPTVK